MTTIAIADPWEPYYESAKQGKGKGKGPPIIPEPAVYGLVFVGLVFVIIAWRQWKRYGLFISNK